ncbi:hypothetical protein [Tsukamurella soli]|uniref:hypothetical protein n=1 Tax=Tsukamurella soli TaxID=644556 RepID=UPI00361EBAAD
MISTVRRSVLRAARQIPSAVPSATVIMPIPFTGIAAWAVPIVTVLPAADGPARIANAFTEVPITFEIVSPCRDGSTTFGGTSAMLRGISAVTSPWRYTPVQRAHRSARARPGVIVASLRSRCPISARSRRTCSSSASVTVTFALDPAGSSAASVGGTSAGAAVTVPTVTAPAGAAGSS